jgi:hypothetical protein
MIMPPAPRPAPSAACHARRAGALAEAHRIVRTLGRRGTVVHDQGKSFVRKRSEESAARKLADAVDHLLSSGLTAGQIRRAFDAVMKARARSIPVWLSRAAGAALLVASENSASP